MTNFEKKSKFLLVFFLSLFSLVIMIFAWEFFSNFFWSVEISSDPNITTEISKNLLNQQDLMGQVVITGLENQNLSSKIGLVNGEGDLEDISGKSNELGGGKIYSEWWKFVLGIEENPSFRPMSEWIKIPEPRSIHIHSFNFLNMKRLNEMIFFHSLNIKRFNEIIFFNRLILASEIKADVIAQFIEQAEIIAKAPVIDSAGAKFIKDAEIIAQLKADVIASVDVINSEQAKFIVSADTIEKLKNDVRVSAEALAKAKADIKELAEVMAKKKI